MGRHGRPAWRSAPRRLEAGFRHLRFHQAAHGLKRSALAAPDRRRNLFRAGGYGRQFGITFFDAAESSYHVVTIAAAPDTSGHLGNAALRRIEKIRQPHFGRFFEGWSAV
jgi:hypothetical protein